MKKLKCKSWADVLPPFAFFTCLPVGMVQYFTFYIPLVSMEKKD